jgi:hypothetical protein
MSAVVSLDPILLAAFAREVDAEWSLRPAREQAEFRTSLQSSPGDGPSGPQDVPGLDLARQRAALSGGFEPGALVGDPAKAAALPVGAGSQGPLDEQGAAVLDALAGKCDRRVLEGRWIWTLKTGPRRRTLFRLHRTGHLQAALVEAEAVPTDEPGRMLRAVLASARFDASAVTETECGPLQILVQALAWAEPVVEVSKALNEARRRLALAAMRDEHRAVVTHGVFGRDSHLRALERFADEPAGNGRGVPVLPLIGIGGSGKSTLISKFLLPAYGAMLAGNLGRVVVSLDFDRILFRPGSETELSFEVSRQLGWARPEAAPKLAQVRASARQKRAYADLESSDSEFATSELLSSSEFEVEASYHVRAHGLDKVPVLLILDTFEEWQRGPLDANDPISSFGPVALDDNANDPARRALEWITRLRERMGLANLRVLLSGRAPATRAPAGVDLRPARVLTDLPRVHATHLLQGHGLARKTAVQLSKLVGGNPLALVLAARYVRNLPDAERRAFLATPRDKLAGLSAELRQGILYDRFLRHIPDEEVARLAHPGLALRRVTPELVLHVLAGPCDLQVADLGVAKTLLRRLAREVWLVTPGPGGDTVRHRPDVRRAMLSLMAADPELAPKVLAIHKAAITWYRARQDADLSDRDAEAEALYHELMLPGGKERATQLAEAAASKEQHDESLGGLRQLSGAAGDLPPEVAAPLFFALGERVSDDLAVHLPPTAWERWLEDRGAALVEGGYPKRAVALALSRDGAARRAPSWLPRAYVDLARWQALGRDLRAYYATDTPVGDNSPADPYREQLKRSDKHRYIAAVLSNDGPLADDVLANLASSLQAERAGEARRGAPVAIDRAFVASLWMIGFRADETSRAPHDFWEVWQQSVQRLADLQPGRDVTAAAHLRRAAILLRLRPESGPIQMPASVGSALFRPDPVWLSLVVNVLGMRDRPEASRGELDAFIERVTALSMAGQDPDDPRRLRLHEEANRHDRADSLLRRTDTSGILVSWSAAFAKALGPSLSLHADAFFSEGAAHVLRGGNPEIRAAVRSVLLECDREALDHALGHVVRDALQWCPSDLSPERIRDGLRKRRRETVTKIIEYVDRCGELWRLIRDLEIVFRTHRDGSDIERAFRRWDAANWRLVGG